MNIQFDWDEAKRLMNIKWRFSMPTSKTDWKRLTRMKDSDIRLTAEHPEAYVARTVRKIVRRGLQPVTPKASISLRIDQDVLDWFKKQGDGYQTRMNAVLRAFKEASGQ